LLANDEAVFIVQQKILIDIPALAKFIPIKLQLLVTAKNDDVLIAGMARIAEPAGSRDGVEDPGWESQRVNARAGHVADDFVRTEAGLSEARSAQDGAQGEQVGPAVHAGHLLVVNRIMRLWLLRSGSLHFR
jgi:hypothetical protein